jgi:hypothetical protein
MAITINGSGTVTGAKFGKMVQEVHAADKGVSTNSGNYYIDYTSGTNAYTNGFTICSLTITPQYAASASKLIVTASGWVSEETDNTDGPSGIGLSYVNGSGGSGWFCLMPRGRMTYSAYAEGVYDGGEHCLGVIDSTINNYSAGNSITIYFKAWSIYNSTKVIRTGSLVAASNYSSYTANGSAGCRSTLYVQEVLI